MNINDLPETVAELERLLKARADGKSAGVLYTCNSQRHRLLCWITGEPDHEFLGELFADAYRPAYEFCRSEAPAARGAAEYDSWVEEFADMVGGGADLGRPGFYNTQTLAAGLTDPPLTAEERADYHWPETQISRSW